MAPKQPITAGSVSRVAAEPRNFELGECWIEPRLERARQQGILDLLLAGSLPDWPVIIPPEMRISRKLAFRAGDEIIVTAGVGLVRREHDQVWLSEPRVEQRAPEGTVIHDGYIARLDLKRDPLGGLSKRTLRLALTRMAAAREAAGGMGIIPRLLAHGTMLNRRRSTFGFLVYAYPAEVEKPSAWPVGSDGFWLGIENLARFLAALHRRLFHGCLYRPGQGFANTLWTTDGRAIPVVTGWGQHAGMMSPELAAEDLTNLIKAGFAQLHGEDIPDRHARSIELVRRALTAYGQLRAAFREQEFDFRHDPVEGWQGSLDDLAGDQGLIERFVTAG